MAGLDACGCCSLPIPPVPRPIANRPGLSAVACRVGTFASFRAAMLAELTRALPELTTRDGDDHAVTLLELWAAVGDVLGFYQERIANEALLRTALHRDSVRMLAALLAYQPRPGLSAEADLALLLDEAAAVRIEPGVRVMSLPGAGEQPQTFETLEACDALAAVNRLRARPSPQPDTPLAPGRSSAFLLDGGPAIAAGDRIALWTGAVLEEKHIVSVTPEDGARRLDWAPALAQDLAGGQVHRIRRTLRFFGWNLPDSYPSYDPGKVDAAGKWNPAPRWRTESTSSLLGLPESPAGSPFWPLDGKVDGLAPGSMLLIVAAGAVRPATVTSVAEAALERGPLKDTVTVLTLAGLTGVTVADRRAARIYEVDPGSLPLRGWTCAPQIAGGRITLHPNPKVVLEKDRRLLIDDGHGRVHAAKLIGSVPLSNDHVAIDFTPALPAAIDAGDAVFFGNVARAGHGETQAEEMLGDGDGGRTFQAWSLSKPDLSRRPSAESLAGTAELSVLVDGVRWNEADSLYGRKRDDAVFTLREGEDAKAVVRFGDGITGSRLPSGRGNVAARYRKGRGLAGLVRPRTLSILLSRPPGLRDAINPAAAEGGADPETLEQARQAAPASVRTFGRIVSLDDFAWVATAAGDIAKALATWVWRGLDRSVHLTVVAQGGGDLSTTALQRLHAALTAARDPNHPLLLASALRVPIRIKASLAVQPAFVRDQVLAAARSALLDRLGLPSAELARPLHASQVIAALQAVPGVDGVDLDALHFRGAGDWTPAQLAARGATADPAQKHLRIFAARPAAQAAPDPIAAALVAAGIEAVPAELAVLAKADLDLTASGGIG